MTYLEIDDQDQHLIEAAREVIRRNFTEWDNTVGAAIRCISGEIYAGVNIDSSGFGACAETITLGMAYSAGEREFLSVVAVYGGKPDYPILAPCGNCLQIWKDYAPDAWVIVMHDGKAMKTTMRQLLPDANK
jgi:cytidine deaminase